MRKKFELFDFLNLKKVANVHMTQSHLTVRAVRTKIHVHVFGHTKIDVATALGPVQNLMFTRVQRTASVPDSPDVGGFQ